MRGRALTLVLGAAIGLLTWPEVLFYPRAGLDPSWQVALHMVAGLDLHHGSEFAFTYGPLGFLEIPVAGFGATSALAAVYTLIIRALLGMALIWAASRTFPLPVAAVLAVVAALLIPTSLAPLAIALVACLLVLQDDTPQGRTVLFAAGGVLSGVELLIKLNVGLAVPFLLVVTALAFDEGRMRNVLTFLAAFIPTGVLLWFASGQTLGNIDDFLSSSAQTVSGYSEALGIEAPAVSWDRAAAVGLIVLTLAATLLATRPLPLQRRIAAVVIVAATLFVLGKQGYVRHDPQHVDFVVGCVLVPWLALRWAHWQRLLPIAVVALVAIASPSLTERPFDQRLDPARAWDQATALLAAPGEGDAAVAQTREALAAAYGLPSSMVAAIGDRRVHTSPWETNLIWAYGLNWDPAPVIQDYAAYTAELDRLNAAALTSSDGPERLLRHLEGGAIPALDGRYPPFDTPAATAAMLCNFRVLLSTESYQLLGRTAPRCGGERLLGSVEAEWGERVAVPAAPDHRSAVFARIEGTEVSGLERLRSFAYRAATRRIWLDGESYRLLPQAGPQGLLLSLPPELDFPAPFFLARNPASLMVTTGDGVITPDGPLEIAFFSVPVAARQQGTGGRGSATPGAASDRGG